MAQWAGGSGLLPGPADPAVACSPLLLCTHEVGCPAWCMPWPWRGEKAPGQVLGEAACRQWGPRGMPSGIRVDVEHLPWGVQLPRPDT